MTKRKVFSAIQALIGATATILIGLGIIYAASMAASSAQRDTQATLWFLIFVIVGGLLTFAGYLITRRKTNPALSAAKVIFLTGLGGLSVITIFGVVILVGLGVSNTSAQTCTDDIKSMTARGLATTVPIATTGAR